MAVSGMQFPAAKKIILYGCRKTKGGRAVFGELLGNCWGTAGNCGELRGRAGGQFLVGGFWFLVNCWGRGGREEHLFVRGRRGELQHLFVRGGRGGRGELQHLFVRGGRGGRGELQHLFVHEGPLRAAKNTFLSTKGGEEHRRPLGSQLRECADQPHYAPANRCSVKRQRDLVLSSRGKALMRP